MAEEATHEEGREGLVAESSPQTRLAQVLADFELAQSFREHKVAGAAQALLREHDRSAGEPPLPLLAEAMAFDFHEDYGAEGGWGTYFGPMMTGVDDSGQPFEVPSLSRVTPDMLRYWRRRADEASHPVLRARYADLVWDLAPRVDPSLRDVGAARLAIDSYVAIATGHHYEHAVRAITKLGRALDLAISIDDGERVAKVREVIIAFEDEIAEDDSPGLWGFSFDLLVQNRKSGLSETEAAKVIGDLEDRLRRISEAGGAASYPHAVEAAALRLARYYRKVGRQEDSRRVLRVYGEAFGRRATAAEPLVGSALLQQVYAVYQEFGMAEDADRLNAQMRELGRKAAEDMHTISAEARITREEIEAYLSAMTEGDARRALTRIAVHFIPKKEEVTKQVLDVAKTAPLQALFTRTIVDHEGRPLARVGSVEEDLEGRLVLQISENMSISAMFLRLSLQRMADTGKISRDLLLDYLYASPLFAEENRQIIAEGLEAFLAGKHVLAAHVLVPQVEAAVRRIVALSRGPIYRPGRAGGLLLRQLDDLLRDEIVEEALGEDAVLYFRVLFTDQRGWNVRNAVCHGLLPAGAFGDAMVDRIVHALLFLALLREGADREREETDEGRQVG